MKLSADSPMPSLARGNKLGGYLLQESKNNNLVGIVVASILSPKENARISGLFGIISGVLKWLLII